MTDAIIPFYKYKGVTSHDCVDEIRRIFHIKKAGHTGTLDPDVEGVLPICTGKATKIADYISAYPKQYEAEITLGYSTDTEDAGGKITETGKITRPLEEKEIRQAVERFQGRQVQKPPMYSAVKIHGKKLYEYAREGKTVERPGKDIEIFHIQLVPDTLKQEADTVSFRIRVTCSKGTFVRTLAVDIGRKLGFPAHMSDLIRTKSGPFAVEDSYTLDELKKQEAALDKAGFSIEYALAELPRVRVPEDTAERIIHGSVLRKEKGATRSPFVFLYKDKALAVYQHHPEKAGLIKPKTMLRHSL
ncbi:tRNA pseudouridine(55) synthase TruB [Salibacterium aidingense]|uniref:tRNA pseudouridine(55) synthase TruB n=1 Tax=Salibacterium aidingense TaxID=384933 RepID=UPI003BD57359